MRRDIRVFSSYQERMRSGKDADIAALHPPYEGFTIVKRLCDVALERGRRRAIHPRAADRRFLKSGERRAAAWPLV